MATVSRGFLRSSIFRKQVIAVTGIAMVGFLVAHLSGNLLIYAGPEAFNKYSEKVASFGPLLWVMRVGLIACVLLHVVLTLKLVQENRAARPQSYAVAEPKGQRSLGALIMQYTGIFILIFLCLHLYDFTFSNKHGPHSVVPGLSNGESLGLFGVVWNSFKFTDPLGWIRIPVYLIAVTGVGLHLSHAIQSVVQTLGFNHPKYTPIIRKVSIVFGAVIGLGFGMIPVYVMLAPQPMGI
jgi:succinate dehydrogenase / fumarate reductase cytochrome b subunit